MHAAKMLRERLDRDRLLPVAGVYDALTARIAHHCGFEAVYMTGYGTAASYGFPDYGLLTMTEVLENLRRISDSVLVPVIADADTGYGNQINVYRTVREFERAGAAGIQLEDQTWPKRCGHMEGKQVIDAHDMVGKIKAAVDARLNSDTRLIIRTDAIACEGFEEAIARGHLYADAGADVLFIEAPSDPDQIARVPKLLSKHCLINMALGYPDIDLEYLERLGYRIALYPIVTVVGTLRGCVEMCQSLLSKGKMEDPSTWPLDFDGMNRLLGIEEYKAIESKFAVKPLKEGQ
jgi:2-methylisocitrate lyase-like PEP mutase family enzyme